MSNANTRSDGAWELRYAQAVVHSEGSAAASL